MDSSSGHSQASGGSAHSTLRQPFIETANALAELYKRAGAAEREAKEVGERAAYMAVLEWTARRSRSGEAISASDVMNFASEQLARIPSAPHGPPAAPHGQPTATNCDVAEGSLASAGTASAIATANGENGTTNHSDSTGIGVPGNVSFACGGDALTSGMNKLYVNPRKRPRVDLDDSLPSVFHEEDISHVSSNPTMQPLEDSNCDGSYPTAHSPVILATPHPHHTPSLISVRKLSGKKSLRDGRSGRRKDDGAFD